MGLEPALTMPKVHSKHLLNAYVGLLALGAAVLTLTSWRFYDGPVFGPNPFLALVFGALLLVMEVRPLPSLTEDSAFTFSWTFAFTLMLLVPPSTAFAVFIVASVASDALTKKRPVQYVFNASQFVLSLGLANLVGHAIVDLFQVRDGGAVSLLWMFGVFSTLLTAHALNSVFLAVVIAFNQRLPIGVLTLRFLSDTLTTDGLLFALAPIFVVVGVHGPILIPVLLFTVWIILQSASIAMRNQEEATHDQLTSLPNRRMFNDHASLALEVAHSAGKKLAVIHIDLDGFKGINDRLGHHFGDQVLKEIASRLKEDKRTADLVARLGGDEFAILLASTNSPGAARIAAERALATIETPLNVDGIPLAVGASIGVAMFPDHGEDLHTLIRAADLAMYEAKRNATGVEMYVGGGDERRTPGRLAIIADLADAIERTDQLSLNYQPVMAVDTGKIQRVEALLRWDHPTYGRVSPNDFMPQTEQTDLMGPLTDKILRIALQDCASWQADGIDVGVSVNASARNLHDLRFPNRVEAMMQEFRIDPSWLEIEITENTIMEDLIRSGSVLSHLRQLGISIAIDDFGTGFSSLVALRDLTIDRIKVDRSFVTNLENRKADLTIVRSVIELGVNLGLQTVAEGVETVEVLQTMRELGCHEYQGFLASAARPLEELLPILRKGFIHPVGADREDVEQIEEEASTG